MFRRLLIDTQRLKPLSAMRMPAESIRVPAMPRASPLPPLEQGCRQQHTDDRSVVKVLNMETDAGLMVDAFSQVGFRLNNGVTVVGPLALFPKTVLSWRVRYSSDINEDSLSLFYLLEPKIDMLILGVGDRGSPVDTSIIRFLKQKGINLEILPTESACTTFNFLNQEGRYVAAGLIPPYSLSSTDDDLVEAQRKSKTLFLTEDSY